MLEFYLKLLLILFLEFSYLLKFSVFFIWLIFLPKILILIKILDI